jgi:hypothetical protein
MESIIVHPHSTDQLNALKDFLTASNMDFESKKVELPQHVLESIERGIKQADNGQTISFEEFKAKHFIGK